MIRPTVNEETTSYLEVDFHDKSGELQAPATVSYRIDCLTTGEPVKGDTSITAAGSVEIEIEANENAIRDPSNAREWKRVTVTATFGPNDRINDQFNYWVRNLSAI